MNYYFCSDLHLGHAKIIEYCHRPFQNIKEMDTILIYNWNSIVKKEDTVFFLGDFCFSKSTEASDAPKKPFDYYRNQLNGNILFIVGNHDRHNTVKTIVEAMLINYGGKRIYLTHNPTHAKREYELNFTGHVHNAVGKFKKLDDKSTIVNLSVEAWNYRPVNINQILSAYAKWQKEK